MKKEYIIPIFVPNYGCPNDCVFCNQKKISGQKTNVTADDVKSTIDYYLENFKDRNKYVEVAFFGGSFTGIDEDIQNELLEAVMPYIKEKKVNSIRLSTRPDYIDKKTLKRLKKYHVKTIELGVQSSNDYVLKKSKRNHTFEDLQTAIDLIKLKPKMVRIYPVLVIKGTELAREYASEEYEPLTIEQAVLRCKEIMYLFRKHKIDIIRIGLQNSEEINFPGSDGSEVLAGP